jgi:hypothetical protein
MPAELLELLRFGTAILAGGIVAVIAQRIAFRHAQSLARDERGERRRAVLRSLMRENEENLERIGPEERVRAPLAVSRSAWDAARELELPGEILARLRTAYAVGADLNSRVAMVDRSRSSYILADPNSQTGTQARKAHDELVDESHRTATAARKVFEAARDALKPVV